MVSKLSAVSLALVATSILALPCTVSSGVEQVLDDLSSLSGGNTALISALNGWDGDLSGDTGSAINSATSTVMSALSNLVADFENVDSTAAPCDAQAFVSAFAEAETGFIGALNAMAGMAVYFGDGEPDADELLDTQIVLGTLDQYAGTLLTNIYPWLPCDIVGQTFTAVSDIFSALNQFEGAWGLPTTNAPVQPQTCNPSPPTCKKQVKRAI
ncbi:hypothetical protein TRVA0_068S00364 [Trichomonascus vanleenenianus]|uniref:uncharacterized protein n=1 Tax=Trichomonascus vanleenenianus TaxID=2268995 RepID=UPI003EC9FB74